MSQSELYAKQSDHTKIYTEHEILVLEPAGFRDDERRAQHIERRKRVEPEVYKKHCKSFFRRMLDPAPYAKVVLKLIGLRPWTMRNALAIRHRPLTFTFDTLPATFHRFRILHLTDLHIDIHPELTDRVIEQVSEVEADICLITGDYRAGMAGENHNAYRYMEKILDHIHARGGVIGILGNHDSADDVERLEDMGVRILLNEAIHIRMAEESIWIAGVDDSHDYHCHDLPAALDDVPADAFKILLAHTPEIYQEAADAGIHLYLCGHTHGGQLRLPGLGPLCKKARCPRQYAHGVWRHGDMLGYTGNGVGTSGTFARMFCPPEIGLIELRCME